MMLNVFNLWLMKSTDFCCHSLGKIHVHPHTKCQDIYKKWATKSPIELYDID